MVFGKAHSRNIPSLDGLRAVAVGAVIFGHAFGTPGFPITSTLHGMLHTGVLGVRIFFVISGFLITTLLIKNIRDFGHINISRFYLRRILRIFPPFYVYALVVIALKVAGLIPSHTGYTITDEWPALLYVANYLPTDWYLGHTWSLAVEEQFYLLWPLVLVVLGLRRGLIGAAILVAASPLIRLAMLYGGSLLSDMNAIDRQFQSTADALAFGCLLAGFRTQLHQQHWYRSIIASRWFPVVPVLVYLMGTGAVRPTIAVLYQGVFVSMIHLGIMLTIDRYVTYPLGRVGSVLNTPPMIMLGVWSYSLYLWQELFVDQGLSGSVLSSFPVNIGLTLLFAIGSYHLIERPARQLRDHIERRRSEPQPALS